MRTAIIAAAVSVLAVTAALVVPHHAKEPNIKVLSVHVVKEPVLTADLLSPEPTVSEKRTQSFVAGFPLAVR